MADQNERSNSFWRSPYAHADAKTSTVREASQALAGLNWSGPGSPASHENSYLIAIVPKGSRQPLFYASPDLSNASQEQLGRCFNEDQFERLRLGAADRSDLELGQVRVMPLRQRRSPKRPRPSLSRSNPEDNRPSCPPHPPYGNELASLRQLPISPTSCGNAGGCKRTFSSSESICLAQEHPAKTRRTREDDECRSGAKPRRSLKRAIHVGDENLLREFYCQRFRDIQQVACKFIAKAWVKYIQPKKQTSYPYSGGDEKSPEWWPKPWGPSDNERVRHKEPDHLYKRERIHLLVHILRLVMLPRDQHPADLQKYNLNIKGLHDVTKEALAGFFTPDSKNRKTPAANNAMKQPLVDELFMVAREEERLRSGLIDSEYHVYISWSPDEVDDYDDAEENVASIGERHSSGAASEKAGSHARIESVGSPVTPQQAGFPSQVQVQLMPPDIRAQQHENPHFRHSYFGTRNMAIDMGEPQPQQQESQLQQQHAHGIDVQSGLPITLHAMLPLFYDPVRRADSPYGPPTDLSAPASWTLAPATAAIPGTGEWHHTDTSGPVAGQPVMYYTDESYDTLARSTTAYSAGALQANRGGLPSPLHAESGPQPLTPLYALVGSEVQVSSVPKFELQGPPQMQQQHHHHHHHHQPDMVDQREWEYTRATQERQQSYYHESPPS